MIKLLKKLEDIASQIHQHYSNIYSPYYKLGGDMLFSC
jgi:hypothetical protein